MRVPAALLAIPLLAGSSAGVLLLEIAPARLILAAVFTAALCLLAALAFHGEDVRDGAAAAVMVGALATGYASGAAHAQALTAPSLLTWFDASVTPDTGPVTIVGRLRDDGASVGYGVLITLDVLEVGDGAPSPLAVRGGVRLTVGGTTSAAQLREWRAGRTVKLPAALHRPITFSNPGVPDEQQGVARRGILLVGSVKSGSLVEVLANGSWPEEEAASARAWTRRTLDQYVGCHDARSAAVATAILIGDRTGLSEEDERRLQDAGTYHVIAISGGNIAILAALLVFGARAFRVPYRAAAGLSVMILLAYGEIAGGAPSVGRAITAAVIFLSALMLDQRGSPLNVLAVASILAVAVSPVAVVDGGFLLSFGATAGIILGVPQVVRLASDRRVHGAARAWRATVAATAAILAATLCAEVALMPIGASLFSRVTFAGLALNFAAIPLMTAVQCGSMLLLAAAWILPSLAALTGTVVHLAATGLVESSRLVALAPWLARDVPPPAWWLIGVYYALCIGWLVASRGRRVVLAALFVAAGLLVSGRAPAADAVPRLAPGVLRVVILDVGQGDATVAILPDGSAILVDAGGLAGTSFDIGGRVVVPALRALGVTRLHALVVTHGDPDHIEGGEAVLRIVPAANIWEGVPVPPHAGLRTLAALAGEQRSVWRTLLPGDTERAGGVAIRILHPPVPDWERQRVRNDDSVVLELRHGDVSILLPGDIGAETEVALIPALDLGSTVVLKAAHHGSATSSGEAFLHATNPKVAIFSSGRNNRFGHPAPVVVERFTRRGVQMFNTAHNGAVFVETDGKSVEVYGWKTGRTTIPHMAHDDNTTTGRRE